MIVQARGSLFNHNKHFMNFLCDSELMSQVSDWLQVVRCFDNEKEGAESVTHVEGTIDPVRDMEIINTELILADLESLSRMKEKLVCACVTAC